MIIGSGKKTLCWREQEKNEEISIVVEKNIKESLKKEVGKRKNLERREKKLKSRKKKKIKKGKNFKPVKRKKEKQKK